MCSKKLELVFHSVCHFILCLPHALPKIPPLYYHTVGERIPYANSCLQLLSFRILNLAARRTAIGGPWKKAKSNHRKWTSFLDLN